jgi:CubicO group peptidase (beta-lactamase class C family)
MKSNHGRALLMLACALALTSVLGGCALDFLRCGGTCQAGRDPAIAAAPILTAGKTDTEYTPADAATGSPFTAITAVETTDVAPVSPATPTASARLSTPTADNLRGAADYSRAHDGDALLVTSADGRVLFEDYAEGAGPDEPHLLASGTKSFWGVLAVAAAEDGLLNLDERVSDTIGEWRGDPRRSRITVRQLLDFTSGLDPKPQGLRGEGSAGDKYAEAVKAQAVAEPGASFNYSPVHLYAFGAFLQRKLKASGGGTQDPLAYLQRRIFDPIGMKIGHWRRDDAGNPAMPNGAYVAPREWIKFGQLVANQGRWHNKQVVAAASLEEVFRGSRANPGYGLTFWLNKGVAGAAGADVGSGRNARRLQASDGGYIGRAAPADLAMAAGKGKQRLYVIPSRSLVVLRLGRPNREWQDQAFMSRLLAGSGAAADDASAAVYALESTSAELDSDPAMLAQAPSASWQSACAADITRLCPDQADDRRALRQCYRASRDAFSADCQQAVTAARTARGTKAQARYE